ncbi:MAG TPA: succinylglutamate desuccinylase/aspartoacylase family protein [Kofleriaceae bacterium]|nr:succinylglutamate desuccinylase/aspartoacylase family protein [Kofleriaceae bacterium]
MSSAGDPRVVAALRGRDPGPTLIVVGGMHGNEPAGLTAGRAVLGSVPGDAVRGEIAVLAGNRRALAAGQRCLARDLNRMWTAEQIAAARAAVATGDAPSAVPEVLELVELAGVIDAAIARARGPVHLLDLHTTSAPGHPFAIVGPTAAHRVFAEAFPLPGILGLERVLTGVLSGYYGQLGCITLAIEGGQHTTGAAADHLAAVVTLGLEASGVVRAMPGAAAAREQLIGARGALPPMIEIAVRHPVRPGHGFRMEPGFANLHPIAAGTLLARDAAGEIRAPFDGVLLLPLYQPDGDDGFFYGRAVG